MLVKVIVGDKKPGYQLILPKGYQVEDLSSEIKMAIKSMGKLKEIGEIDLSQKELSIYAETVEAIKKQGAYLWKIGVKFNELVEK
jgi:hypothetical protein